MLTINGEKRGLQLNDSAFFSIYATALQSVPSVTISRIEYRIQETGASWTEPALSEAEWDNRMYRDIVNH